MMTIPLRQTKYNRRILLARRAITIVLTAAVVTLVAFLAARGGSPTSAATLTPPSTPQGPTFKQEWKQLIITARVEGEIVITAGGSASRNYGPILQQFQKQFGIKVVVSRGSGSNTANRVLAERRAGRYTVDIGLIASRVPELRLMPARALDPIETLFIHPEVTDKSLWYRGRYWYAESDPVPGKYIFIYTAAANYNEFYWYNTTRVGKAEIAGIKSWADFLDPKWKGRIGGMPPDGPVGIAQLRAPMFEPARGPKWMRRYLGGMDVKFAIEERILVDWLAQGRVAVVAISTRTSAADWRELQRVGLPVAEGSFPMQRP